MTIRLEDDIDKELAERLRNDTSYRKKLDEYIGRIDHRGPDEHFDGLEPKEHFRRVLISTYVSGRGGNFHQDILVKLAYIAMEKFNCTDVTNLDIKNPDYVTGSVMVDASGWIPRS